MSQLLIFLAFAMPLGFVISAIVSNVFGLVSHGKSLLTVNVKSDAERLAVVGLLLIAGPHILARAASRSLAIGDWPPAYVWGSFALSLGWSFIMGFAVLAMFT